MVEISKDIEKIKNYLYEAHLEVTMHTDFDGLVKLKSIDDELRETLILLHSNYKAEFQAIKNHNFRVLLNMVDVQHGAFEKLVRQQSEANKVLGTLVNPKKSGFSVLKIVIPLLTIAGFIVLVFYLFNSDKEAGKMVIELIKTLMPKIL